MPKEIERKFLVNKDYRLELHKDYYKKVEQYYISKEPEIRLRKIVDHGLTLCFQAIKDSGLIEREEIEFPIPKKGYGTSKVFSISNVINKDRHYINLGKGLIAELDIYKDRLEGLEIVEVEFKTKKEADIFMPPEWFGEEVTYDKSFRNINLAILDDEEIKKIIKKSKEEL